jgi:8-oxo-dGTP diphosphatase
MREVSAVKRSPRHSVSVAGVVVDDAGRALMVERRDNGKWEPPGGILELDEAIEEGVRREVLEETGLDVEVERLTGVYKNLPRGVLALVFLCRPLREVAAPGDETAAIKWMTPREVGEQADEAYAVRVLDALDSAPPRVAIRTHDGVRLTRR